MSKPQDLLHDAVDSDVDDQSLSDSDLDLELDSISDVDTQSELDDDAATETSEKVVLTPKEQKKQILDLYHKLSSRRVDLVGDYAGGELFMVEGDSVLLNAFSDPTLDFQQGFQLVHAVYLVESFLHSLLQRKCNFHVVFFEENKQLCVPDKIAPEQLPKYMLARAAIIRHLQAHTPDTTSIKRFDSINSEEFNQYLATTAVYFGMMHDGSAPLTQHNRLLFRTMILSFISRGYNVALVNGLEWRDTKVMTMVLERSRQQPQMSVKTATSPVAQRGEDAAFVTDRVDAIKNLSQKLGFTERELLAVTAVSRLLKEQARGPVQLERLHQSITLFLLHIALLKRLPISARRFRETPVAAHISQFLSMFAVTAERTMESVAWASTLQDSTAQVDVCDAIDGRLFNVVASGIGQLPREVQDDLTRYQSAVKSLVDIEVSMEMTHATESEIVDAVDDTEDNNRSDTSVMPFSNPVFDKHLKSIHLSIDEAAENRGSNLSARIFREVSHWHNAKKPLAHKGPPTALSAKEEFWIARRNQWFMAEMRDYASSLTNSIGKSLDPETIVVGAPRPSTPVTTSSRESPATSDAESKSSKNKNAGDSKKKPGKVAAKNAGKQAMLEGIAAANAKKEEAGSAKLVQAWHFACKNMYAEPNLATRYALLKDHFTALSKDRAKLLAAEVQLCMLSVLLEYWIEISRTAANKDLSVAGLIWHTARAVLSCSGQTKTTNASVEMTLETLNLPRLDIVPPTVQDRALPFKFALPSSAKHSVAVDLPAKEFQLLHCGPYLDRSIDSAPDHRVEFEPDLWQRKVLDGIDADKSLLVVAPTSAGKTFISFYAMRKVLEADDDSVLVYVAPTKALVNQIAAEIQARYSKKFKYPGKSVWAIHTRDYRINNSSGCQILVTVPHVLQIMLLAPSHANSWSTRVKRIIFDEVHSIGNADDGVVWEQLLLLAPCPIIALSATVGNPSEFHEWLSSTQAAIGNEVVLEGTTQRYSDLRKFNYVPPQSFAFSGLPERASFSGLGLDGTPGFAFVHPVASLINTSRGMPEDLSLEPRDCFTLWSAMVKHQTKSYPVPEDLNPLTVALPQLVGKKNTIPWERDLKALFKTWMAEPQSPFDKVFEELSVSFYDQAKRPIQASPAGSSSAKVVRISGSLESTTLPLLCSLHEQNALPAIFFNYDRGACEVIAQRLVEQLETAESDWKENSPKWKSKLKAFEEWKLVQEKQAAKKGKGAKASTKKMGKDDREDAEGDRTSKLDQQRDAGEGGYSEFDSFDPEAPVENFHFADLKKLQASEMETYVKQLRRKHIAEWLIKAISRGVGVHHAGMNRKYRQVVEILFRKGYLRVIIATGTLALGINMPCKTVVFSGDSVFLTALNFRQGAGRAGRRGFDLLGNVVFQGIPETKISRLLSSRLPDLNGHFPVTTTLTLRLFSLLHESKNSPYAVKAINSLLSQPRLYMGGPAFKDQTLHHLRFSIEYLRRQRLLDSRGATLNFAGLVSHLYYTENSSFAFHALLKEGYFHRLCANVGQGERTTVETLMLVMSHLFGRVFCRQADEEYRQKVVKPSSSMVFLPSLPEEAANVLRDHADDTLQVFRAYVSTFIEQHIQYPDNQLPLSKMQVGANVSQKESTSEMTASDAAEVADDWDAESDPEEANTNLDLGFMGKRMLPPTKIRSQFVSLSGQSDKFSTIADLCRTTRSGVFLEQSVIPHVGSYPEELGSPLNAYLLDFFKHGDVKTLARANRIRAGEVWFLLNDFSMVLATIITSLMNFMKLKPSSDLDMLEVMGNLDALEEAEDDKIAASETDTTASTVVSDPMKNPEKPVVLKKKGKKLDSWEDDEDEEASTLPDRSRNGASNEADVLADAAWDGEVGEKGLLQVLKAFQILHKEFNEKFKAMWA